MAAQDAELKLKVSLDLGFFRQQLAGLGQAAAGYSIPVQVKFDRRSVQNELNALSANIRRRDYRLNIQTNLKEEIENAKKLAAALAQISSGSGIGAGIKRQAGTFRQELGQLDTEALKKIYAEAAKASLVAFDQETSKNKSKIVTALNQAAQEASQGFLNALSKENSKVRQAAGEYGDALLNGLKKTLKIQSPSKEMFDIGDDAGKGFELGLLKSLEIAEQSAGRQMRRMLDRLARMALMMTGMSAAEISRQAMGAARPRGLPGIDFPATVPTRTPSIGPSSTGRLLPEATAPQQLPGTRFGAAGFLPGRPSQASILEFNNILAGAIREYFKAVAKEIVKPAKVSIAAQPLLGAGSKVAGLLPAAGGTTPVGQMRFNAVRTGAVLGQPQFMRAPSIPTPIGGGAMPPGGGGGGGRGGGGAGGLGGFGRAIANVNLPGVDSVRELGSEFGYATKQVLLFGQAYKALAFIQSFPGQVGEAVAQLQSFRNTLNSVTGSAEAAGAANEFILAAVEKYNIPLQSARDGFTKLFASMEPAGFAAGEIQNLFLGITKAAATYGMSADKVDRVNYAFAQMASKGQVMSEELKGQLGDVLPGAMGIFAEAAGFKGPDAIQKFGKALEDGVYKGGEMRKLLRSVADGMNREFGPGAEGAAKTFQGSINRMQNALKGFYESFEPAAIGVLNQVAVPLVTTLKNITDGVNAYFKGQAAATPEAQNFANTLKTLVPTISGIAQNLSVVFTQVSAMGKAFLMAALQISRLLALPIVGYLASTYAQVVILSTAFNFLAKGAIGAAIIAISQFIARGVVFAQVSLGMRVATQQTTVAMYQFGTAVQSVMIKSVIGIALVAISSLIAKFVELQNAMASVSGQSKQMQDAAKASAKLGDVSGVKEAIGNMEDRVETYKKIKATLDKVIGGEQTYGFYREIPTALAQELMKTGLIVESSMKKVGAGYKVKIGDLRDAYNLATKNVTDFNKAIGESQGLVSQAQKKNQQLRQQGINTGDSGLDGKNAAKAAEDARKLADDKAKYEAKLMELSSQQALSLNEMEFDHWKNLQQAKYDILEAGQNDWMSREIKFQRDLQAIEIRRLEAIRKARIDTVQAETKAQAKSYVSEAGVRVGVGTGGATFGATGRVFNAPGFVHGHFQNMNRDALVQDTVEVVMKLLQQGVTPELGGGQKFTSGMSQSQIEKLVRQGIASHKSYASGIGAVDVFVPQGTKVPVGLSGVSNLGGAAGISGNLPRGTQLMHLAPGSTSGATASGMPASRIRAEAKKDYEEAIAAQEAINAKEKENIATKYANIQAQQELNALIKNYIASMMPVEQQKLENNLLKDRIGLMSSGMFGEALDMEQKISEAKRQTALGIEMANARIETNNKLVKDGTLTQAQANELNKTNTQTINELAAALENYIPSLREKLRLEQQSAEANLQGQIQRATPLGGMGLSAGFIGEAGQKYEEAIGRNATPEAAAKYAELQNQLTLLETRNEAVKQSIYSIGDAFGEAMTVGVASLVDGTATAQQVFSNFLKAVGDALLQAASQMISTYIAIGIAKAFAGLAGGAGAASQGAGSNPVVPGVNFPMVSAANGAVWKGGFQAFANGGVVKGPTLGLVGEGKYNEAIVPLPDGRSIPVQFNGGRSAREMMNNGGPGSSAAPALNMTFETKTINGVEYVSREQLENAMASTRAAAISRGARQGMEMTLEKLRNSPTTRNSIGMR